MSDRRTTRRQVFGLGAAAFAAASLKSPAAALADRRALFELDLSGEGLTASAAAAAVRQSRSTASQVAHHMTPRPIDSDSAHDAEPSADHRSMRV